MTVSTTFSTLGLQSSATLSISEGSGILTITSYPALDGAGCPNFDMIAKGQRSSAPSNPSDPSIDWISGTPIYGASDGSDQGYYDGNGYAIGYRYQIPVTQSEIANGVPYFLRFTDHYVSSSGSGANAGKYCGNRNYSITISGLPEPTPPDDPEPDPIDISSALFSDIPEQAWTGEAIEPDFKVTLVVDGKSRALEVGTDYSVAWSGNVDPGTATVTITGEGSYTGTASTTFQIVEEEPSKIDEVKAMIDQLPTDSYAITEEHIELINRAKEALEALSEEDQAQLNTEEASSSQPYGRILETAVWTVTSFTTVDNATTLANGTYTNKAVISSDMGKSTSPRQRKWILQSITAKGGKATAKIKWEGYTPLESLRLGNEYYSNLATDGTSVFEIPVDLNSDMYFAVKAKGATDTTDALAYHMVITMDESSAKPDKESDDPADKIPDAADKASESGKNAKASTSGRSGIGSSLKRPAGSRSGRGSNDGLQKASYSPGSDGFVTASTTGAGLQSDNPKALIALLIILGGAIIIGATGFTARFRKLGK
ncbi:MAG: hypothetical protein K6G78_06940 [bacterium]|nr:hypothetical protein [bacterium]